MSLLDELKEKLPDDYIDGEKVACFVSSMLDKFEAGRQSNKGKGDFDPLFESQQECLDLGLYSMLMYFRIERFKEKLNALGD